MLEYVAILFAFLTAFAVTALLLWLPKLLSPTVTTDVKSRPFECGKTAFAAPRGQFSVHFYIIAMFFIVFDVELVFLFPWAVTFKEMGLGGLLEMAFFLGFVLLGYVYVWKKRALEWE